MLDHAAATRLDRQLHELPEILAHAYLALLPGTGARGARVTGATRSAPLPCSVDALSLFGPAATGTVHDDHGDQGGAVPIIGTLISWARLIETEHPCSTRPGREHTCQPDASTIGSLLAYLTARDIHPWTVLQPWADEYAAEIGDVHRAATRLSRTRPRRTPLHMPCPRCDMLSLIRQDGRDIECVTPDCGVLMRQGDYDWRAEQLLDELYAA